MKQPRNWWSRPSVGVLDTKTSFLYLLVKAFVKSKNPSERVVSNVLSLVKEFWTGVPIPRSRQSGEDNGALHIGEMDWLLARQCAHGGRRAAPSGSSGRVRRSLGRFLWQESDNVRTSEALSSW